jgi:hypothetical protein
MALPTLHYTDHSHHDVRAGVCKSSGPDVIYETRQEMGGLQVAGQVLHSKCLTEEEKRSAEASRSL